MVAYLVSLVSWPEPQTEAFLGSFPPPSFTFCHPGLGKGEFFQGQSVSLSISLFRLYNFHSDFRVKQLNALKRQTFFICCTFPQFMSCHLHHIFFALGF